MRLDIIDLVVRIGLSILLLLFVPMIVSIPLTLILIIRSQIMKNREKNNPLKQKGKPKEYKFYSHMATNEKSDQIDDKSSED